MLDFRLSKFTIEHGESLQKKREAKQMRMSLQSTKRRRNIQKSERAMTHGTLDEILAIIMCVTVLFSISNASVKG